MKPEADRNPDPAIPAPVTSMCRTSVLAAMFAVPACCPPMSLLAAITGLMALRQIRRDPLLHGRGLAWAAVAVGLTSAVVFSGLLWNAGLATLWRGPNPPVTALMRGDTAVMAELWTGPGRDLSASEILDFAAPLERRHGAFREARNSATRLAPLRQDGRDPVVTLPITLVFERGQVEADLGLQPFDAVDGHAIVRWRSLRVLDPDLGDPVFPPGDAGPPPLKPVPTSGPPPRPGAPLR